ncbi:YolD-like family protein [Paenibacillus albus]|uniref:YolD-like family protein n=1 Tax=Paenibacillus albus TaxID=2495582 RepID=A0A3Q8X8Z7_9BACL|nr:YolD-like family protein [Paenibacillus albus]AZN42316.1 YolD-like family protein [Paenibacillus albus]
MGDSKKLTAGGNWLWEDSRMMLPEHKLAQNEHQRELRRRERKHIDEAEWSEIAMAFGISLQLHRLIMISMFDPFEDTRIEGVVERVDQLGGRFMVDGEWFPFRDIEGAVLADAESD